MDELRAAAESQMRRKAPDNNDADSGGDDGPQAKRPRKGAQGTTSLSLPLAASLPAQLLGTDVAGYSPPSAPLRGGGGDGAVFVHSLPTAGPRGSGFPHHVRIPQASVNWGGVQQVSPKGFEGGPDHAPDR